MNYGLNETAIKQISALFYHNRKIEKVILYGSRAKGNYKPSSDVDITLVGDDLNLDDRNELAWKIDDLLLPFEFDISLYQYLQNENLLEHINRVGRVLFERSAYEKQEHIGA